MWGGEAGSSATCSGFDRTFIGCYDSGCMRAAIAFFVAIAIPAILLGCASPGSSPASYLGTHGLLAEPRRASFDICRTPGCMKTGRGLLSDAEWERVRSLFTPPPADPREERARAARAVGLLGEWFDPGAGARCDGAGNDPVPEDEIREERARASLTLVWGDPGAGARCSAPSNEFRPPRTAQLDCIAEASNTTVYLLLLERDGLLSRHRVRHPARRGFLLWSPHNTAVLEELATGRAWAMDSWYGPSGSPAPVWPLELWLAGKEDEGNRENAGLTGTVWNGKINVGQRLSSPPFSSPD